ncbi:hypothetical protein PENSTE_c001G00047 [Penicillium steckii]|uniref:CENP-Q, a CENPA-CAD centromere complex subunit-domain-containing protein n=1 Tax=Penicillium steckii TaxID=303698 RepID=A0A1V6TYR3_9EURO|nr:hypothetical protein PENSTE_c001G00047 [Penicillium steckii]
MPPKRKRTTENEDSENSSKRYAHLKPQVRRVPEKTIKTKWTTLPEPVQEKVRGLFHALERPVIMRNKNEQKRIEAQNAVQAVVRNLERRLPRMPFPPISKDSNFDFESALNEHQSLEANLSVMSDSINLLKSEIAKEQALLASEKTALHEMDKNAKRADAERKRQMKKEHPVLRQLDNPDEAQDGPSSEFTLVDGKNNPMDLNEWDDDPEIQTLMKQLHGHLQSMESNITPLTGLREALTRSQAALDLYSND